MRKMNEEELSRNACRQKKIIKMQGKNGIKFGG